jgi:hypothetical protein
MILRGKTILLASLIFTHLSLAAPLEVRIANAKKVCMESRHWENERCAFTTTHRALYQRTNSDRIRDIAFNDLGFLDLGGALIRATSVENSKSRRLIDNLSRELIEYRNSENLDRCHSACLAKCMSHNLLTFSDERDSKFQTVSTILENGLGQCTEFAEVYNSLASTLEVPSVTVGNSYIHAYNSVEIDSDWWFLEPQDETCTFFKWEAP